MATTHALVGVLLAVVTVPDGGTATIAAAAAGGVAPDLDLFSDHRHDLHFPVYGPVAAASAAVVALGLPSTESVGIALFLAAAGLHAASDVLGGGLELRPWEATSERAVYDHYHGRWLHPRRLIRYDGAPEDLMLALALAAPAFVLSPPAVRPWILGLLAVSAAYALVRRRMVGAARRAVDALPELLTARLPTDLVEPDDDRD